jgi:magnesium transporter
MQIIDLVESYRDITTGLIDMNLSFISNRMNEIMKVLTIISSIFIPLTFIAGVYGMNFAYQDPETGKVLHKNMPELYMEHGYEYALVAMLVIAILQVIYFWRKGWLSTR